MIKIENYNKLLPEINNIVEPVIVSMGAELIESTFTISYSKLNLNIFVYKIDGVDLDVLEAIHNAVTESLDSLDEKFDTDYILNISSPGLDRLIKTNDDFRRSVGTEIELFFENEVDGRKKSHGILISYNDETIEIEIAQKQNKTRINFERKNITKTQPFVRF